VSEDNDLIADEILKTRLANDYQIQIAREAAFAQAVEQR
jgi:hypothetical protein